MFGISKICLGTAQYGLDYGINNQSGKPSESEVFRILDYASQQGVSNLDSAESYGSALEILGRYNHERGVKYRINSKFSSIDKPLRETLELSLVKLKLNSINVFYFHDYGQFIANPEYHRQIIDLKKDGLITQIGLSIYDNSEFCDACKYDFVDIIQFPFNVMDNTFHRGDLIKFAVREGKLLHARSVYLQGLFFMASSSIPEKLLPLLPYLKQLRKIARNENISIGQMALNYVLQNEDINYVIIGVDSLDQLKQNLEYSNRSISEETIDAIDRICVDEVELLYPKNW